MKYPDFWHKEIACPNKISIQEEIKTFLTPYIINLEKDDQVFEHIQDLPRFIEFTPSLTAWLQELGCGLYKQLALIITGANKNQNIHTDAQKNELALNIGLQVDNTSTRMYKIIAGKPKTISYGSQGLTYIDYSACELEQHTEYTLLNNPVLFNTKHIHNVINPTDKTRIAVSIRFFKDPDHLIS